MDPVVVVWAAVRKPASSILFEGRTRGCLYREYFMGFCRCSPSFCRRRHVSCGGVYFWLCLHGRLWIGFIRLLGNCVCLIVRSWARSPGLIRPLSGLDDDGAVRSRSRGVRFRRDMPVDAPDTLPGTYPFRRNTSRMHKFRRQHRSPLQRKSRILKQRD